MRYSYNKLWYLLVDKKMTRTELRKQAGITTNALTNMGRKRPVSIEVLAKICTVLAALLMTLFHLSRTRRIRTQTRENTFSGTLTGTIFFIGAKN